jgi:hypothetical protein
VDSSLSAMNRTFCPLKSNTCFGAVAIQLSNEASTAASVFSAVPALKPMPLSRPPDAFSDPDWLFELNYDRFCAI